MLLMNPAPSKYSMYYVYLLKSRTNDSLYIGYTKKYMPWELLYYESFISLEDAKKREKSLKYFGRAYSQLKKRIMNSLNVN